MCLTVDLTARKWNVHSCRVNLVLARSLVIGLSPECDMAAMGSIVKHMSHVGMCCSREVVYLYVFIHHNMNYFNVTEPLI